MEAGRIRAPSRTVHDPSVERLVECVLDRPAVAVAVHGVRTPPSPEPFRLVAAGSEPVVPPGEENQALIVPFELAIIAAA